MLCAKPLLMWSEAEKMKKKREVEGDVEMH
jgi:hypothetical protein